MGKRGLIILLIILQIFLYSCSIDNNILGKVKNNEKNKIEKNIEFQLVDQDIYNNLNDGKKQAYKNPFDILTVFVDKDGDLVPATITQEKTLFVATKGIELTKFNINLSFAIRKYGLNQILPQDIVLRGISYKEQYVKVDFSNNFYNNINTNLFLKAVTYLLTSYNNVQKVIFLSEDKVLNQFYRKSNNEIIIYYPKLIDNRFFIIPKWVKIKYNNDNIIKNILETFVNSISISIPLLKGLRVNKYKITDKSILIDFSKQIKDLKGEDMTTAFLESLVFTIKEIPNIQYIKVLSNSQPFYLDQYDVSKIDINTFKINKITIE
ncbi:GerMN domain-containing protein [Caldicellulosiruptoraceae bacterium PP1]